MRLKTTTYNYNNNEMELVLCYRSRPFAVLSSSLFPTPNSSYIDHHLVMELGLKMTDIGCRKFSFCGKKLRINKSPTILQETLMIIDELNIILVMSRVL